MLIILILALAGTLWLAHRLSLLLSLSLDTSIKSLNIPIPKIPLMTVDKISDTSVAIHWDNYTGGEELQNNNGTAKSAPATSPSSNLKAGLIKKERENNMPHAISHHLLYINGIETLKINGNQKKFVLEGLRPSNNYQIDLVTFNNAGFRSKSSSIFIKTAASSISQNDLQNLDNINEITNYLLNEREREDMLMSTQSKSGSTSASGRSRSGTIDDTTEINACKFLTAPLQTVTENGTSSSIVTSNYNSISAVQSIEHINLIEDINELKLRLESGLNDLYTTIQMGKMSAIFYAEQRERLLEKIERAQAAKTEEAETLKSLQSNYNSQFQKRVNYEVKIATDSKRIKERKKNIETQRVQIEELESEILRMSQERDSLLKTNPNLLKQLKEELNNLNKEIFILDSDLQSLDHDVKDIITARKDMEADKQKIIELFDTIDDNSDDATGLLNDTAIKALEELSNIMPSWKDEVFEQFVQIDQKEYDNWKALQQQKYKEFTSKKGDMVSHRHHANGKSIPPDANANSEFASTNTTDLRSLTAAPGIMIPSKTADVATNTTNATGFVYNSTPATSASNIAMNNYNSQNYNSAMRNIMRPRLTTDGSFQGTNDLFSDLQSHHSAVSNSNSPWNPLNPVAGPNSANLAVDNTQMIPSDNREIDFYDLDLYEEAQKLLTQAQLAPNANFSSNPHLDPNMNTNLSDSLNASLNLGQYPKSIGASYSPPLSGNMNPTNISALVNKQNSVSSNLAFDMFPTQSFTNILSSSPQNNGVRSYNEYPLSSPQASLNLNHPNINSDSIDYNAISSSPYNQSSYAHNYQLSASNGNLNNKLNSVINEEEKQKQISSLMSIFKDVTSNSLSNAKIDNKNIDFTRNRSGSIGSTSIWSNGNASVPGNTWGAPLSNLDSSNINSFSYLSQDVPMTSLNNEASPLLGYDNTNINMFPIDSHQFQQTANSHSNNSNGSKLVRKGRLMFSNTRNHDHTKSLSPIENHVLLNHQQNPTITVSSDHNDLNTMNLIEDVHKNSPNDSSQSTSFSFFKNAMSGKFGTSPTKTFSNKSSDHDHDHDFADSVDRESHKKRSDSFPGDFGSIGSKSSKISKLLLKNPITSSSQHSNSSIGSFEPGNSNSILEEVAEEGDTRDSANTHNNSNSNSNSNNGRSGSSAGSRFMSRKLSIFKRDKDKDKDREHDKEKEKERE